MKRTYPRVAPEENRILYVRNLPFKMSSEEMYDLFGKYGPVRQIRVGNKKETKGTAYVVYYEALSAKEAQEKLSGFSVKGRYLVVIFYNKDKYNPEYNEDALQEKRDIEKLNRGM
eukprot:augustus_masked-scaffold_4-processed-gene-6.48-mRNA-1 protein AED:0.06 eAED:0.06 QI:0/-1/0/1/-1/1/1/0/114